jgi:hypothetical protein
MGGLQNAQERLGQLAVEMSIKTLINNSKKYVILLSASKVSLQMANMVTMSAEKLSAFVYGVHNDNYLT